MEEADWTTATTRGYTLSHAPSQSPQITKSTNTLTLVGSPLYTNCPLIRERPTLLSLFVIDSSGKASVSPSDFNVKYKRELGRHC